MKALALAEPFPMVAHQGGWDEILLVVGPLAVIGGALWLANRRVSAQLETGERTDADGAGANQRPTPGPAGETAATGQPPATDGDDSGAVEHRD